VDLMTDNTTAWPLPGGPPPAGRTADLLCTSHTEQILTSLIWPADLELGAANTCADCRAITGQVADGLYAAYDRREHDVRLMTAEHEAGHAVANIVLGHTVHGMFLTPPQASPWDGDDGRVDFTCDEQFGLICDATAIWAGPVAHREGLNRRGLLNTANIIGTAKTAAADARGFESFHLADWAARSAREHAQTIVREHWADIERLAAALAEKSVLNGQEVLDLVVARGK
jgi:hypothetical protein